MRLFSEAEMKNLGYYNGRYGLLEYMSVPMLDRSITFGDAVYESVYARNYILYRIDEHIDRFFDSCGKMDIRLSFTKNKLKDIIFDLNAKVDSHEQMIYWQASRGTQLRSHVYDGDLIANLLIMIFPRSIYPPEKKIKMITAADTRHDYCHIKNGNLLTNTIERTRAAREGCDEVIFIRDNSVTECSHSNIAILKDGVLITAPVGNSVLNGIARKHLIEKCKNSGIKTEERFFTVAEMKNADVVINCSAGALCNEVESIDGEKVGGKGGELFDTLQKSIFDDFYAATTPNG